MNLLFSCMHRNFLTKFISHLQGCESSYFNLISDFFTLHKPHFQTLNAICIEKHIFSGISDYFRLFLTDAFTPVHLLPCATVILETTHSIRLFNYFDNRQTIEYCIIQMAC